MFREIDEFFEKSVLGIEDWFNLILLIMVSVVDEDIDNGKKLAREEDEKALLVQDGLGTYEWSYQVEEEATDFALMDFTSNPSSSLSLNSEFNEKEVLDVKEEEVTKTMFDNRSSDEENSLANDRFKKGKGYHIVPPPLTGNYMPPKFDPSFAGLDDSIHKFKISKIVTSLTKDEKVALETNTALPTHIPVKIDFAKAIASTSAAKLVNTTGPKQSGHCWVIIILISLNLATVSFGVDAAIDFEEKHSVFNASSKELSAAKKKMMLLDSAAGRSLMLPSQVKTVNDKCCY
nr:hypothetical protein [Tanacetum cinerariifolium]